MQLCGDASWAAMAQLPDGGCGQSPWCRNPCLLFLKCSVTKPEPMLERDFKRIHTRLRSISVDVTVVAGEMTADQVKYLGRTWCRSDDTLHNRKTCPHFLAPQ